MRKILESYSEAALRNEIKKTNITGYSKFTKAKIVDLMLKHKGRFSHMTHQGDAAAAREEAKKPKTQKKREAKAPAEKRKVPSRPTAASKAKFKGETLAEPKKKPTPAPRKKKEPAPTPKPRPRPIKKPVEKPAERMSSWQPESPSYRPYSPTYFPTSPTVLKHQAEVKKKEKTKLKARTKEERNAPRQPTKPRIGIVKSILYKEKAPHGGIHAIGKSKQVQGNEARAAKMKTLIAEGKTTHHQSTPLQPRTDHWHNVREIPKVGDARAERKKVMSEGQIAVNRKKKEKFIKSLEDKKKKGTITSKGQAMLDKHYATKKA